MAVCKLLSVCIPVLYMRFVLLAMCEPAQLCVCLCTLVSMYEVHVLPVYMALYERVYVHSHIHV